MEGADRLIITRCNGTFLRNLTWINSQVTREKCEVNSDINLSCIMDNTNIHGSVFTLHCKNKCFIKKKHLYLSKTPRTV